MERLTRRQFIRNGIGGAAAVLYPSAASVGGLWAGPKSASSHRPNIILIMADDMGFSDLACYGSEIDTPNLNRLAAGGLQFTQFYNCARCCPTRASLLTGLYPHQAGIGLMMEDYGSPAYRGDLSDRCVSIAEALRQGGYHTLMCGKWHVTPVASQSKHNWPLQRGFEKYFGTIDGAGSYYDPHTLTRDNTPIRADREDFYYTDAISENAARFVDEYGRKDGPFFLYVAYTAPHWPLHALPEDIAKYANRYQQGWDKLRAERHRRMIGLGLVDKRWPLSLRDPRVPPWDLAPYKEWEARRMAVYAAQIDRMDRGIGSILAKVKELGLEANTLILFLSDNGGNYEEAALGWKRWLFIPHETGDGRWVRLGNDPSVMPGPADTYQSYGIPWGNASNTPFRLYKHFAHEGGIATPLIAYWPAVITSRNALTDQVGHVMDVMATCLEVAGVPYPQTYAGREITPLEGKSLLPIFQGKQREPHEMICWEHEGNSAVRQGKWKLVSCHPDYWELHDMEADRTELNDLADQQPERVREMAALYERWAKRLGVEPWPLRGQGADEVPAYLRR
jgi:arylsulfatase A-like enzyme